MDHSGELYVVGVYILILVGIGYAFGKLNKNVNDYFRSGCKGTWWLVGMSVFISSISTKTFTGNAGAAFEAGWSPICIYIGGTIAGILSLLVVAHPFSSASRHHFPRSGSAALRPTHRAALRVLPRPDLHRVQCLLPVGTWHFHQHRLWH